MRNPKYVILGLAAYVALIGALSLTSSQPAQTQGTRGPDVRVVNQDTEPVPVREVGGQAQEPVEAAITGPLGTSYTVPAGKRLVVEFVSGFALENTGELAGATLQTRFGGNTRIHRIPLTLQSATNGKVYIFASPTKFFADAGTEVSIDAIGIFATSKSLAGTLVGYLIDVP